MAQRDQVIPLDKLFTKWVIKNVWENKTADFYADEMWNLRIKNWGITVRKWKKTVYFENTTDPIQGITANEVTGKLFVVQDGHLFSINLSNDPVDKTDIWDISHTWSVDFVNYGIYTIILTWAGYPRVYNNATLSQLSHTSIAVNTNPSFWSNYAWFTVVNSTLNPNAIRVSRPITLANQEYCYDFAWSGSEPITFDSKVLWFVNTLQYLRVFTAKTIEYISRGNLTTTWWVASLFTIPIAEWDTLINSSVVCAANEYIFYATDSRKIKTINYVQWNPNPQVATISEEIDEYMQRYLDDDQSKAFCYYDKVENLVKFHFKSKWWLHNDVCVIRDIAAQTFFFDDNKVYWGVAQLWSNYYASSPYLFRVTQDGVTDNDEGAGISRKRYSAKMSMWNPVAQKKFRGNKIAWKINRLWKILREFIVDGKVAMSKTINWSQIPWNQLQSGLWIWWHAIGASPISSPLSSVTSDMLPFTWEADQWAIRTAGQWCQIRLSWSETWQKLVIDFSDITIRTQIRTDTKYKV